MKIDGHRWVDDVVKILVAMAVTATFCYEVVADHGENKFEALAMIGPLVGMIVMYYFKDKKSKWIDTSSNCKCKNQ